jgi:hypothetical protein
MTERLRAEAINPKKRERFSTEEKAKVPKRHLKALCVVNDAWLQTQLPTSQERLDRLGKRRRVEPPQHSRNVCTMSCVKMVGVRTRIRDALMPFV